MCIRDSYYGVMVLLESPARALRGFAALPHRGGNDLEFLFSVDAAAVRREDVYKRQGVYPISWAQPSPVYWRLIDA